MAPRIELHIEELVLHGFDFGQRYDVAESLRASLAEALVARGVPQGWAHGAAIDRIDAGTTASADGAAIAGAIDRAVRRE